MSIKETNLEEIDLYEYGEIFDDPDYLPHLNVSESELHELSFQRFRELGKTILAITDHKLISYAKLNDDNTYVSFNIGGNELSYRRIGLIDGFMPFETGLMLYCDGAEEFASTLSKEMGRSPAFG